MKIKRLGGLTDNFVRIFTSTLQTLNMAVDC